MHPRETQSLAGHKENEAMLKQMLASRRLPHGFIFAGPKGVGKATFAYHLARFLFKGSEGDFEMDPQDPLFRRVVSQGHGDLFAIEKGLNTEGKLARDIPIDSARKVVEFLHKTSLEGGWRIVIVDSVDEMNRRGANALLKILEEPPKQSILILISHSSGRVLPTLRSRCQMLHFNALSSSDVKKVLEAQLPDITPQDLDILMKFSEGCPGRALDLASLGGAAFYHDFLRVIGELSQARLHASFEFLDKYLSASALEHEKDSFQILSAFLSWWLARMLAGMASQEASEIIRGESTIAKALIQKHPLDSWTKLWARMNELFADAQTLSLDRKHVLISIFSEMAGLTEARARG